MVTNEELKQWKPLVKKIAYKYKNNPYRLDIEDIEQIGYIGLMRGLKTFDESKGTRIQSYLYKHIKWDIDKEIEYLKRDKRIVLYQSTSLDVKIDDSEDLTLGEMLEDTNINILESIIESFLIQRYKEEIKKTLTDPREREIILKIFFEDLDIEVLAKELEIDKKEAREIYRKAKEKLRRNMFIRDRYLQYKENIRIEKYKTMNFYRDIERSVIESIELEQKIFNLI